MTMKISRASYAASMNVNSHFSMLPTPSSVLVACLLSCLLLQLMFIAKKLRKAPRQLFKARVRSDLLLLSFHPHISLIEALIP